MKTKLIFFGLLCFSLSFGQNRSLQTVGQFDPPGFPNAPIATEIFRFRPGLVTQIQDGTGFGFSSTNRWFSLGNITQGTQNFYGLRLQSFGRGLTMGYTSASANNPRIEWIGNGAATGNLEFRVGTSFGSVNPPTGPGPNLLVATMTQDGRTVFGDPTAIASGGSRVVINNNSDIGFKIESLTQTHGDKTGFLVNQPLGTNNNTGGEINVGQTNFGATGLRVNAFASTIVTGITANAENGTESTIGVSGVATPDFNAGFAAGIYGRAQNFNNQQWAGFFEGRVFAQAYFRPQIQIPGGPGNPGSPTNPGIGIFPRMMQVKPHKYNSGNKNDVNAASNIQHGFVADELEQVFPELVKTINQPVFDKSGKLTTTIAVKAIDYDAMIPLLIGTVQELNKKIEELENALENIEQKTNRDTQQNTISDTKVVLEQNIPNPFSDRTTIKYQLPEGVTKASLLIFDLNGAIKKEFQLSENKGEVTVTASQIGKGLFIYSLVQNGQILATKKMIIQ